MELATALTKASGLVMILIALAKHLSEENRHVFLAVINSLFWSGVFFKGRHVS